MNTPKISIILPVYNVQDWIEDAIGSVLSQTLQEWEAIFVIDGSLDKSEEIVRDAMKNEPRIRILLQENQGQGAARDNGVSHAKGEYIFFLDPDDLMPPNALEVSYNRAVETDADIVIGDYRQFNDGEIAPTGNCKSSKLLDNFFDGAPSVFSRDHIKDNVFYHSLYFAVIWMKLIKKSTWQENNVCSPKGITMCEDTVSAKYISLVSNRISITPNTLIYYRKRKNSATANRSEKAFDIFESYQEMNDLYTKLDLSNKEITLMRETYIYGFVAHLYKYSRLKDLTKFYEEMQKVVLGFDTSSMELSAMKHKSLRIMKAIRTKGALGVAAFIWETSTSFIVTKVIVKSLHFLNKTMPRPVINPILSAINWIGEKIPKTKSAMDKVHSHLDIGR